MKTNFTATKAKALRISANKEFKGMNHAIKAIKAVWDEKKADEELLVSIKAAKADGLKRDDFSAEFITGNLDGSKWVVDGVIMTNKKGAMVAKVSWTPGQVVDYVRRANAARLAKAGKDSK